MAGVGDGRGKSDAQLYQSLLDLYDVADNVFNTILSRVKLEQEKLNSLTARIVDREDVEGGTLELFRFFSETNHEYWPRETQSVEGLGRVLKNIKSVADCMLFNSLELPYHLYRVVDNLAGADIIVGEEEPKHKPAPLAVPPQSVLAGDTLSTSGVQEHGFRPMLGEVPPFSLPSTLLNLPMIADISWNGSPRQFHSIPLIAPAVGHYRTASFGDSSAEATPTKSDTRSLDNAQPVLSKPEASQISGSSRLPTIVTKIKNIEAVPSSFTQAAPALPLLLSPPPPPPPPPPPLRSPAQPIQTKIPQLQALRGLSLVSNQMWWAHRASHHQ